MWCTLIFATASKLSIFKIAKTILQITDFITYREKFWILLETYAIKMNQNT